MTHQRPLPDAAQSPYPLHPAPHDETSEPAFFTKGTHHEEDDRSRYTLADRFSLPDGLSLNVIGMGAAIGLGVAAIAGALLYGRRRAKASPTPRPALRLTGTRGDDTAKRGAADRRRVAGGEPYEVNYFARKHGLTTARARQIIKQAGSDRAKANALAKNGKA